MKLGDDKCYLCKSSIKSANDENEIMLNMGRYIVGKCCFDRLCDIFNGIENKFSNSKYHEIMEIINKK